VPHQSGRKPFRKEVAVFYHRKRLWLAMSWAGLLGDDCRARAEHHIAQWQSYARSMAK
jgi:hypothetical protein